MDHETLSSESLFASEARAFPLTRGQRLCVVNTNGGQVVDMWALVPPPGDEVLSMAHTRIYISRLVPRVGDLLWSNHRRPMLRLVEDTSPGVHDTLIAACDDARYRLLGHRGYHENCSDNFRRALRAVGITRHDVPDPLNLFQNTPWDEDGTLGFETSPAEAGDRVTFEALADLVVVLSVCPMDLNSINGYEVRDVEVRRLLAAPDGPAASDGRRDGDGAAPARPAPPASRGAGQRA